MSLLKMKYIKSKVANTCKLKLHIPLEIVNKVFAELDKNYEISGVIHCNESNKVTHVDTNKGDSESVYTPNDVINFHTHPVSAYNGGDTVWGWPSGEDVRETIKFAMAGNKAHLVFTVEGLYTIQISPCKLIKLSQLLDSNERGILIFLIEEYFKCIHNFRCVQEVNKLNNNNIKITPYSFIDLINTFSLNNILKEESLIHKKIPVVDTNSVGHTGINSKENDNINRYYSGIQETCSKMPNTGFLEVERNYITTTSTKKYIDDLSELRSISKMGEESDTTYKKVKDLFPALERIIHKMNEMPCETQWNNHQNAWFFVNFFPTEYYTTSGYFSGKRYITPNKKMTKTMTLAHEPFIRIFSNSGEGCTITSIAQKNNFSSFKLEKFKKQSSFGFSTFTNEQMHILFYIIGEKCVNNQPVSLKSIQTSLKKTGISMNKRVITQFLVYLNKEVV